MDRHRRAPLALIVALVVVIGAGCGDGAEEPATPPPATSPVPGPEPSPTPRIYVVRRGDTLSEIAERFETTVRALVRANGIEDRHAIQVGDELVIPES